MSEYDGRMKRPGIV